MAVAYFGSDTLTGTRTPLCRTQLKPRSLAGLTWASVSALGGIRTPNLLIRSQMLYPLSYERTTVAGRPRTLARPGGGPEISLRARRRQVHGNRFVPPCVYEVSR